MVWPDKGLKEEAKDTVMNDEQVVGIASQYGDKYCPLSVGILLAAQAEISFKAGAKEVVEWLGNNCVKDKDWRLHAFTITQGQWQAKLKEWDIDTS